MPPGNEQISATRTLLHEVCALIAEHRDDAVLVGGWVPDVLFPESRPPHIGSVDVDLAMRLNRPGYERLVTILKQRGFHQGSNGYQFFRQIPVPGRRPVTARLDLLTSRQHHARFFAGASAAQAPEPIRGAEVAFADNQLAPVGNGGQLRVAGIVAFLVMKSLAMHDRDNRKDAYDIHFCLEQYPDGLQALSGLFHPWLDDPLVKEALTKMASKFRSGEDDGPQVVADIDQLVGESRAIRKLQVALRVQDFLRQVQPVTPLVV
ncbi:hypothetical protein OpiT1DRAFT_02709 [Opitutaceae bacterium TAV1]|nr:hypothetical protein OpiT1DRAFT_02709 [Opitutaceae bacterium TAV1]